jgi:hypothetical protein
MTQISMSPPSSHTKISPARETVRLSTPLNGPFVVAWS